MQNSPMHERHGVHACANLNLVAPLATQATASRCARDIPSILRSPNAFAFLTHRCCANASPSSKPSLIRHA